MVATAANSFVQRTFGENVDVAGGAAEIAADNGKAIGTVRVEQYGICASSPGLARSPFSKEQFGAKEPRPRRFLSDAVWRLSPSLLRFPVAAVAVLRHLAWFVTGEGDEDGEEEEEEEDDDEEEEEQEDDEEDEGEERAPGCFRLTRGRL
jgi:hypothetical protein